MKKDTTTRTIVVSLDLWKEARQKAIEQGKSLSCVIRKLLQEWVTKEKAA